MMEEQDIAQKLDCLTKLVSEVKLSNEVLTEKVSHMDSRIGQAEELCRNAAPTHGQNAHMSERDRSWQTGLMDDYFGQSTHQIPNRSRVQGTDRCPVDNVGGLGSQRPGSARVGNTDTSTSAANRNNAQEEFQVIKDALQRVKLPSELKVDDTRQGIQRRDQGRVNVISKCARYAETTLKLLSTLQADNISEADLRDLSTIAEAQVRYLQEEQSLALVTSTFGDSVERLYKGFKKRDVDVEALRASVLLSNQMDRRPRGRGRGGYQQFGRGSSRGRFSQQDSFSNMYTGQAQGRFPSNRFNRDQMNDPQN